MNTPAQEQALNLMTLFLDCVSDPECHFSFESLAAVLPGDESAEVWWGHWNALVEVWNASNLAHRGKFEFGRTHIQAVDTNHRVLTMRFWKAELLIPEATVYYGHFWKQGDPDIEQRLTLASGGKFAGYFRQAAADRVYLQMTRFFSRFASYQESSRSGFSLTFVFPARLSAFEGMLSGLPVFSNLLSAEALEVSRL